MKTAVTLAAILFQSLIQILFGSNSKTTANISLPTTAPTNETGEEHLVTYVADGDTVKLENNQWVRLLGINAPEVEHKGNKAECFSMEARKALIQKTEGKKVILRRDGLQGDKDKYGRWLRYIYIGDDLINADLVKDGYAYSYREFPTTKTTEFNQLEQTAKDNHWGLWGICKH